MSVRPKDSQGTGGAWPWAIAGGTIALFAVSLLVNSGQSAFDAVFFGSGIVSFALVGAVLASRVSGNPIGRLLLAAGALTSIGTAGGAYARLSAVSSAPFPLAGFAGLAEDVLFIPPIAIVLIGIPLIFPTGTFLSPRWRHIVWLTIAALLAVSASNLLRVGPVGSTGIPNPLGVPGLEPALDAVEGFANLTSVIGFGAAAVALGRRFRLGTDVERQQLKWLVSVAAIAAIAFPISFVVPIAPVADVAFVVGYGAFVALPVAIGLAVLRYRLYDIDRVISRSISWAIVTGTLVAVFGALVLGLQAVLAGVTQGQTLAVAASTLVAYAAFQPLRRRVQGLVDRRFNRARYDAESTVVAFAGRLRDEVDAAQVHHEILQAVHAAVAPRSTTLWLRPRNDLRTIES